MTTTGRRGRRFWRGDEALDDPHADLSEDEHAWWAAREEVAGVPRGVNPEEAEATPAEDDSQFSSYWTAESLYDEPVANGHDPTDPGSGPDAGDAAAFGAMDLDAAHLVLQVDVGSDWEEVTKAHRRLAKQYHPDRLIAYSVEAQELGRGRMAEINAAHATLRALHFH